MMECFDRRHRRTDVARLEVSAGTRHGPVQRRRVPPHSLPLPLAAVAKLQDGLGGKAKAITFTVIIGVVVLILAMIFVPYPLKMKANGQVWPQQRPHIFPPFPGKILEFASGLKTGSPVLKGQELVKIYSQDLAPEIVKAQGEVEGVQRRLQTIEYLLAQPVPPTLLR